MSWTRKRPFTNQDAAIRHMRALLAEEARDLGSPLRESDLDLLARESPLSAHLEDEVKGIISHLLAKEELQAEAGGSEDPRSFSNTLKWANEPMYPNIARLTEEVISDKTKEARLHGWPRFADGVLLVICGIGVVLLMMVFGYLVSK